MSEAVGESDKTEDKAECDEKREQEGDSDQSQLMKIAIWSPLERVVIDIVEHTEDSPQSKQFVVPPTGKAH